MGSPGGSRRSRPPGRQRSTCPSVETTRPTQRLSSARFSSPISLTYLSRGPCFAAYAGRRCYVRRPPLPACCIRRLSLLGTPPAAACLLHTRDAAAPASSGHGGSCKRRRRVGKRGTHRRRLWFKERSPRGGAAMEVLRGRERGTAVRSDANDHAFARWGGEKWSFLREKRMRCAQLRSTSNLGRTPHLHPTVPDPGDRLHRTPGGRSASSLFVLV